MGVSGRDEEICAIQSPMTQLTESMKELQTDKRLDYNFILDIHIVTQEA